MPPQSAQPRDSSRAQRSGSAAARGKTERSQRSIPTPRRRTAVPPPPRLPVRPVRSASSSAVPLHQRLEADRVPSQPSESGRERTTAARVASRATSLVRWCSVVCAPSSARRRLLADHVGQQSQKAGAFDGPRQLPLLLGGHRRNPTQQYLAALGDIALQEPH